MRSTFKLTLAYEGTDFVGWQRQATGRSVQSVLEDALSRIEGTPVTVIGAGRTDAGVHAYGQVASVMLSRPIDALVLRRALNATLPPDVRVLNGEVVADGFNARYATHAKSYRYRMICGEIISPFDRRFAWHVPDQLAVPAMCTAAAHLKGRHDFSAFQSVGSDVTDAVREIMVSRLETFATCERSLEITYDVTADGFLRHMVRAIVGTLIAVGTGRIEADNIVEVIASRDRQKAGPSAPAHGLCLMAVHYTMGEWEIHESRNAGPPP